MITVGIIDLDRDYDMVCSWWKEHKAQSPHRSMLPKLGVMAYSHGIPAAAAWCYMDNSVPVAMISWQVTNPTNAPKLSVMALDAAISFICDTISDFGDGTGYGAVLTLAGKKSVKHLMERKGFKELAAPHWEMVRVLKEAK